MRELEWSDLAALSLTSERISNGVTSTYPRDLAASIEDLVERETGCCGTWLDAKATVDGDVLRISLTTASPEGLSMLVEMAGLAT